MGDFVFLSVPDHTDALEVSFTPFPWPETLQHMLAGSSGPSGIIQVACVLAEPQRVTVWGHAAEDLCLTSQWDLPEFQPPLACTSCCCGGWSCCQRKGIAQSRVIQNCCLLRHMVFICVDQTQKLTLLPALIFLYKPYIFSSMICRRSGCFPCFSQI